MQTSHPTLGEIAKLIDAKLEGNPECRIHGLASLENALTGQIAFLGGSKYQIAVSQARYLKHLSSTKASAVILNPIYKEKCPVDCLVMDHPYEGYIKVAHFFQKKPKLPSGIHPTVVIGEDCDIHESVCIGPNTVIGDCVVLGQGTVIMANTVIGDHVQIGKNCHLWPNVSIYHHVVVGNNVIIHSGVVIGSDGFGMYRGPQSWKKIPHIGSVKVGNDVEIGANTTIDRGTIHDTTIEDGVKLDNQIQIGHNVCIGENTVVAGCTGIGGSSKIGKDCMIGGAVGIADNVEITDRVVFTGMTQVPQSITKPGLYSSGTGVQPHQDWKRNVVRFHNLDALAKRIIKKEHDNHE